MGGLLRWAVQKRVVILLACSLALVGGYAFVHVDVEAYPDPAPAIIEDVAQYPGASAEGSNDRSPFRWKSDWLACRNAIYPQQIHVRTGASAQSVPVRGRFLCCPADNHSASLWRVLQPLA